MDNTFQQLRQKGVDLASKSAETFSKEEENQLWECGVLGASTLFESGVREKIIQQQTGYRSLEGLCHYEQTTMQQQ